MDYNQMNEDQKRIANTVLNRQSHNDGESPVYFGTDGKVPEQYQEAARSIKQMQDAAVKAGYKADFIPQPGEPGFRSIPEMLWDIEKEIKDGFAKFYGDRNSYVEALERQVSFLKNENHELDYRLQSLHKELNIAWDKISGLETENKTLKKGYDAI